MKLFTLIANIYPRPISDFKAIFLSYKCWIYQEHITVQQLNKMCDPK